MRAPALLLVQFLNLNHTSKHFKGFSKPDLR